MKTSHKNEPRELALYCSAKQRCENKRHRRYPDWGGRGIEFKFNSFKEFIEYLGPCPEGLMLDRIDNDGPYSKGNVKWSTPVEQRANRRMDRRNLFGIVGVSLFDIHSTAPPRYIARIRVGDKYEHLYYGPDFFEACCKRKSREYETSKK